MPLVKLMNDGGSNRVPLLVFQNVIVTQNYQHNSTSVLHGHVCTTYIPYRRSRQVYLLEYRSTSTKHATPLLGVIENSIILRKKELTFTISMEA